MTRLHKWLIVVSSILLAGVGLLSLTALEPMTRIAENSSSEPAITNTFPTLYLQECLKFLGWAVIGLTSLRLGSKAKILWFVLAGIIAIDAGLLIRLHRYDGFVLAASSLGFLVAAGKDFAEGS